MTRRFVQRRHARRRRYLWERVKRITHRLQKHVVNLRDLFRRFFLGLSVGICLLVVGLVLFSPIFQVREIRVLRTDPRIDVEQVQRALGPIFRQRLFSLSSQDVSSYLEKAIPDLTDVSLQKRYPSSIILRLTLDPVVARLSIQDPAPPQAGSGAVAPMTADFLTSRGMYVTYLPSQVKGSPPVLRIVDWGARPTPWTRLIAPAFLLSVREAEQELQGEFGQEITERTVYLRAQEFHLKTKTIALWFDRRSPLDEQFRRYRIFLRAIGVQAAKEYVDLRLKDRIVYR